jgi:hypothetical protein
MHEVSKILMSIKLINIEKMIIYLVFYLFISLFIYLSGGSSCQNLPDSLSDEVPSFTGQIENLPEISGSPASFAISELG